jgi:hypothetical protein
VQAICNAPASPVQVLLPVTVLLYCCWPILPISCCAVLHVKVKGRLLQGR